MRADLPRRSERRRSGRRANGPHTCRRGCPRSRTWPRGPRGTSHRHPARRPRRRHGPQAPVWPVRSGCGRSAGQILQKVSRQIFWRYLSTHRHEHRSPLPAPLDTDPDASGVVRHRTGQRGLVVVVSHSADPADHQHRAGRRAIAIKHSDQQRLSGHLAPIKMRPLCIGEGHRQAI